MNHGHARGLPEPTRWLTVGLPAVAYPLVLVSLTSPPMYEALMRKEGLVEFAAAGLLLVGVGLGVALLVRYRAWLPSRWLTGWFGLATMGMFVFAGEEVSWGQHLGWWDAGAIPEPFKRLNDQQETNLHNMSNTLDQGPTNAITLVTLVAFVALPLWLRWRGEVMGFTNPGYWFWPTRAGLVAAAGVLVIPFPKRVYEGLTGQVGPVELRHSEMHEFYIALLMVIYVASAFTRLRGLAQARSAAAPAQAGRADRADAVDAGPLPARL